jgi:phosphoglycerate dehydrogenase-like enzyme
MSSGTMYTALILDDDAPVFNRAIEACGLEGINLVSAESVAEALPCLEGVQIILGRPDYTAQIIHEAPMLQWVQSTWAGIEPLCGPGLRSDYLLTGVKDIFGPLMSEYVFGYILAQERNILKTYQNQVKCHWEPIGYRGLNGLTLGLVGTGSIGLHVAGTARHFGMNVLGMKRTPGTIEGIEKIYLPSERTEFFPQLDYLVVVLPDTPGTRDFITEADLELMKDSAILVNVGRGSTIRQQDLVTGLQQNSIGGAILDVFAEEPLPPDSPLWQMDNVLITPHNSAFSFPSQISSIFCENYRLFRAGKDLKHLVEFDQAY